MNGERENRRGSASAGKGRMSSTKSAIFSSLSPLPFVWLTPLRGLAVFGGGRSLFINEMDEKVFTTGGQGHFVSDVHEALSPGLFAAVAAPDLRL
jgi:hypothetical protein